MLLIILTLSFFPILSCRFFLWLVCSEMRDGSHQDDRQYHAGYLPSAVHVRCDWSATIQGNFRGFYLHMTIDLHVMAVAGWQHV